jgi:hypothetical protein
MNLPPNGSHFVLYSVYGKKEDKIFVIIFQK